MRKVPLVIHPNGERKVVGEAFVSDGDRNEVSLEEVLRVGAAFGTSPLGDISGSET